MDKIKEFILKLLYLMQDQIKGSTMVQKIMYILRNEYGNRIPELQDLAFRLHFYGPFSREISNALNDLSLQGLLSTEVEQLIDYLRYDYGLTENGRQLAQRLYEADDRKDVLELIARRARELDRKPLKRVIAEAYRTAENEGL